MGRNMEFSSFLIGELKSLVPFHPFRVLQVCEPLTFPSDSQRWRFYLSESVEKSKIGLY